MDSLLFRAAATLGLATAITGVPIRSAHAQADDPPIVFQAAGPDAASIQGAVEAFRAALGNPNNASNPGPLATGRREINWDGGGDVTTTPVTPFDVFLDSRGARFTTPGDGLTQAPPTGGPQGGLAGLFANPTYATTFRTFSPQRLFAPVGSRVTEGLFFVPGTAGADPATVRGFGAVFTDVDRPIASGPDRNGDPSALVAIFGRRSDGGDERLLFRGIVPASPGDGHLSFLGVVFEEPRITRVRITTGTNALRRDDGAERDLVAMDDFLYGEPQPIE